MKYKINMANFIRFKSIKLQKLLNNKSKLNLCQCKKPVEKMKWCEELFHNCVSHSCYESFSSICLLFLVLLLVFTESVLT